MDTDHTPMVVAPEDGRHFHFLNHLATVKVGHDTTASRLNVTEFEAPRGFGPPVHVHHHEDEVAFVIDGEVRFCSGEVDRLATTGAFVVLPRAVPHTFQVESPTARMLAISVGGDGSDAPSSFDLFVSDVGEALPDRTLPSPTEIDPAVVAGAGAAHGIEVVGPPPGALA